MKTIKIEHNPLIKTMSYFCQKYMFQKVLYILWEYYHMEVIKITVRLTISLRLIFYPIFLVFMYYIYAEHKELCF